MISFWIVFPAIVIAFIAGHFVGVTRGLKAVRVLSLSVRGLLSEGKMASVYDLLDAADKISMTRKESFEKRFGGKK